MIRKQKYQLITATYEVFESESSTKMVGRAYVDEGYISQLQIDDGANESYHGQILNRLLRSILEDADKDNCNLLVEVNTDSIRLKRVLERYGFALIDTNLYKRISGTSLPPSVII